MTTQEYEELRQIHNDLCVHFPLLNLNWLGCPYEFDNPEKSASLYECNLCGLQIIWFTLGDFQWNRIWQGSNTLTDLLNRLRRKNVK